MRIRSISNPELGHFLKREQPGAEARYEVDLAGVFAAILSRANEFLPSEAGSIFVDDPVAEEIDPGNPFLVLIACFGARSEDLVGIRLPADRGIAGHVYRTGRAHISAVTAEDGHFYDEVDGGSGFATRSVVCAPLRVEGRVIGVLELLNHVGGRGYDRRDLELLEIFAQTISASIVNAIDAQRAKEMAKRDELTGLYNDRYLHHRLSQIIGEALASHDDCGLIFIDLDQFKQINDHHGHLAGSRVLSEVGAILHQILPGQSVAARYGGDEFVIVLPQATRQELYWVAETVRKNIESFVFLEHADPRDPVNYPALAISDVISCSLGLATLNADVLPVLGTQAGDPVAVKNELIRQADASMYKAKQRGRNLTVAAWTWKCARKRA